MDLRCHGESSSIWKRGPHSVASAARDVLQLVCDHLIFWFNISTKQVPVNKCKYGYVLPKKEVSLVNCDGMQRHQSKNIWTWVLAKMGQLKLTPRVLIGHSFGGKGVQSYLWTIFLNLVFGQPDQVIIQFKHSLTLVLGGASGAEYGGSSSQASCSPCSGTDFHHLSIFFQCLME